MSPVQQPWPCRPPDLTSSMICVVTLRRQRRDTLSWQAPNPCSVGAWHAWVMKEHRRYSTDSELISTHQETGLSFRTSFAHVLSVNATWCSICYPPLYLPWFGLTSPWISLSVFHVLRRSVTLTVVDRFSKYAHFLTLAHPHTATSVACFFSQKVVCLHGIPSGSCLHEPILDGAVPFGWRQGAVYISIPPASRWSVRSNQQNNSHETDRNGGCTGFLGRNFSTIRRIRRHYAHLHSGWCPFRVVYGREPPSVRCYEPGSARVQAVVQGLAECDEFLVEIKDRLEQAQQHFKKSWTYLVQGLRVRQRRLICVTVGSLDLGSTVCFKSLSALGRSLIAFIFLLEHSFKMCSTSGNASGCYPYRPESTAVSLRYRMQSFKLVGLVACKSSWFDGWKDWVPTETAWVPVEEFRHLYLAFKLEDELLKKEGRDVIWEATMRTG
ncbi:hypothetical protein U9M48_013377 [Paspalum notatum var. saurae]|uniref:Chromo domain-containing protein n=1 Tax=Paspalum notatum var. saurae TaxID=547442 RepID=A0AAQ3WJ70_PASNO